MSAQRLVLFDMDGTLIDSQDQIVGSMCFAFDREGLPAPSRAEILSIVGLSLPEAVARLAPGIGPDRHLLLADHYRASFAASREPGQAGFVTELYPGARETLDTLFASASTLLGVATGKSRRGLDHVFQSLDLARYFVTSQTCDDHPSKPHPSMIHTSLAATACDPSRTVMVGDTSYDMEMAKAAGVTAIGVSWGYHRPEVLWDAGADVVLDSFHDLDGELNRLLGSAS